MAPLADTASVDRSLVVTAYQSASGLLNLVNPTFAVVMGVYLPFSPEDAADQGEDPLAQIEQRLGYRGSSVMVHRDDLVLFDND